MTVRKALDLPKVEPGVEGRISAVPEPGDIVLRILKTIQQDYADFRKEFVEFRAEANARFDKMNEDFAAMQRLMTFHMGITFQHKYQLEHIDAEIRALKAADSTP
jgi:hypothetical protein